MAKKKNKYEVVDFTTGGFFIHGGNLRYNHFESKEDADETCAALNMLERLKLKTFQRKLDALSESVQELTAALKDGTENDFY